VDRYIKGKKQQEIIIFSKGNDEDPSSRGKNIIRAFRAILIHSHPILSIIGQSQPFSTILS
jgi:hypothetical protein